MASGPCVRRCRVVRKYIPTNIETHPHFVNYSFTNHVSMYFEPFQSLGPVNTAVPPSGSAYAPQTRAFHYRALRVALKLSRLKSVVHVQLDEDAEGLRWAFRTPPDLIITCARFLEGYVRRTLPERYQDRQHIIAVSNPVDTQRFHPGDRPAVKRHVGAPSDVPLALMLANLAPHKGQETAIKAIAALKKAGVEAVLWLAGVERGGERHYTTLLHKLCAELGVEDRVQFLGYRSDVASLLRAADVF